MNNRTVNENASHQICTAINQQNCSNSQKETPQRTIRIEIPTPEYNKLLKLALQRGTGIEQLVAQNIRHLSE